MVSKCVKSILKLLEGVIITFSDAGKLVRSQWASFWTQWRCWPINLGLLLPFSQIGERLQAQDIRCKERMPVWEVLRSSCNARSMDMFELWLGPFSVPDSLSTTVLQRLRRWSPRPVAEAALAAGYEWGTSSGSPKISLVSHKGFCCRKSSRLIIWKPKVLVVKEKEADEKLKNQKEGPIPNRVRVQGVRATALEDEVWCSCLRVTPLLGASCASTFLVKWNIFC